MESNTMELDYLSSLVTSEYITERLLPIDQPGTGETLLDEPQPEHIHKATDVPKTKLTPPTSRSVSSKELTLYTK
jgi:hypothetical protein